MIEACELATELRLKVEQSVAAAQQYRLDRQADDVNAARHRQLLGRDVSNKVLTGIAIVVAVVLFILGLVIGGVGGGGDEKSSGPGPKESKAASISISGHLSASGQILLVGSIRS